MSGNEKSISQWLGQLTPEQGWKVGTAVAVVLTACVTSAYWFGDKFAATKLEDCYRDTRKCESRWQQLEPHVKKKMRIDIQEHIIYPYIANPPQHSETINDEFYADKDIAGMTYSQVSQKAFYKTFSEEEIPECLNPLFDLAPMHVWRTDDHYKVFLSSSEETRINQYPYISVIRIPITRLRARLFDFFKCAFSPDQSEQTLVDKTELIDLDERNSQADEVRIAADLLEQLTSKIERLDNMDIVGLYWAWEQIIYASNFLFSAEIEKRANIVNGTNVFVYKNVSDLANGQNFVRNDLYVRRQKILVQVHPYVYVIEIASPTLGMAPDTDFDGKTGKWLTSLRIINR